MQDQQRPPLLVGEKAGGREIGASRRVICNQDDNNL
jgi:hypothetical protein